MHWLQYSLLGTILCAAYCQDSVDPPKETEKTTLGIYPGANDLFNSIELESNGPVGNLTQKGENHTGDSSAGTSNDVQVSLKSSQKREVENVTFNHIKPFFLFPILPFLFPPKEEENLNPERDEFSKNETSKVRGNPTEAKPFIFFDFAFNIRQIPISNATENLNDSKIIKVKKLSINSNADDVDLTQRRRRRNTKMETPGFLDDDPLFPDSEMDEFFPKPELFFPNLAFRHKPSKKLSRRKRDQKKTELKNDFKSFFDAFDEAFMRTNRELEWTDPLLNFLRGGEQAFEEKKNGDDLFAQLSNVQEKPSVKWRIKNFKKLNSGQDGLTKNQDGPTIIVDKVVKIGEFQIHDDGHDNKEKKKRGLNDVKRFLGRDNRVPGDKTSNKNDEVIPESIFELMKQEGSKRKKRYHLNNPNLQEETSKKAQSREVITRTQTNVSFLSVGDKPMPEPDKKNRRDAANNTEKLANLMKMFDSLKGKMGIVLKNDVRPSEDVASTKDKTLHEKANTKKIFEDNLKKNLTELLKQFLALDKNLDDPKRLEGGERDGGAVFSWEEKDAAQNTKILGKGSEVRRQKKDAYFEDEYVTLGKKEKEVADLNYLFLNVTLPTVFVFAIVLLICFFSLQVKGRICTKLFKPRHVLIVNDETTARLKNPSAKKVQAI